MHSIYRQRVTTQMDLQMYRWYGWWPAREEYDEEPTQFSIWCKAKTQQHAHNILVAMFRFIEYEIVPVDNTDRVIIEQLDFEISQEWNVHGKRCPTKEAQRSGLQNKMSALLAANDDARHFFDFRGIEPDAADARVGFDGHRNIDRTLQIRFSDYKLETLVLKHADDPIDYNMNFYTLLLSKAECDE